MEDGKTKPQPYFRSKESLLKYHKLCDKNEKIYIDNFMKLKN